MTLVDYHVHTPLCNHARGCMESYVKSALGKGLAEICFLDHLTLRPEGRGLSMGPQEVPLYYTAARKLAARYEGRIAVKVGLEVDFFPGDMEPARRIVESFAFDAVAGSVHFLGNWDMVSHKKRDSCPFRGKDQMCSAYLDHLEALVEHSFFDFVGHLDVVGKFDGLAPDCSRERWEGILGKIAARGLAVELNTSGLRHPVGRMYPAPWLLQRMHGLGIAITLGSDAHAPEDVGRDIAEAAALARTAGYTQTAVFTRRVRGAAGLDA